MKLPPCSYSFVALIVKVLVEKKHTREQRDNNARASKNNARTTREQRENQTENSARGTLQKSQAQREDLVFG